MVRISLTATYWIKGPVRHIAIPLVLRRRLTSSRWLFLHSWSSRVPWLLLLLGRRPQRHCVTLLLVLSFRLLVESFLLLKTLRVGGVRIHLLHCLWRHLGHLRPSRTRRSEWITCTLGKWLLDHGWKSSSCALWHHHHLREVFLRGNLWSLICT